MKILASTLYDLAAMHRLGRTGILRAALRLAGREVLSSRCLSTLLSIRRDTGRRRDEKVSSGHSQ
jgi:hypothetical protein